MSHEQQNFLRGASRVLVTVLSVALLSLGEAADNDESQSTRAEISAAARDERTALQLFYGKGQPADRSRALVLFERGANAGRPISQWMIALELLGAEATKEDLARAFALTTASANQGLADAQTLLGWMYKSGRGVARDSKIAARWFACAVRQEDPRAALALAQLYAAGDGVERRDDLALELIRRAAELGEPIAMVHLASSVWYGKPEHRDIALGRYFLEKSASLDNEHAAFVLARSHLSGDRMPQDFVLAARWMSKAADRKHPVAPMWMSELYAKGLGVDQNTAKAQQLLTESLAKATVGAKNEFAWQLAVSPNARLRNGALAVRVMSEALKDPSARRPAYLDTLAAAYAEVGDFKTAIEMQQQALAAVDPRARQAESNADMYSRLADYKAGRAFRESQP